MKNNEQKTWKPEPPFIAHAMEFYQSDAFRSLSNAERKILARIEIEHMKHGGKDNGRLACLYDDFVAYGVRRRSISAALAQLQTVGILHVTQRGRRDAMRNPHFYRLTYLPSFNGKWPTNEWRLYRPNSPPQQTTALTTIKRNSGGIRQKPRGENATGPRGENAPRSGGEIAPMWNPPPQGRNRSYYLEEAFHLSSEVQPVTANADKPVPEPATTAQPLEHGLQAMLDILTGYLGNSATRGEWLVEIQRRFTNRRGKLRPGWSDDSIDRKIKKLEQMGLIAGGGGHHGYWSASLLAPADNVNDPQSALGRGDSAGRGFLDVLNAAKLQILKGSKSSAA